MAERKLLRAPGPFSHYQLHSSAQILDKNVPHNAHAYFTKLDSVYDIVLQNDE